METMQEKLIQFILSLTDEECETIVTALTQNPTLLTDDVQ